MRSYPMANTDHSPSAFVIKDELRGLTLDEIFERVAGMYAGGKLSLNDIMKATESIVELNKIFSKQEEHHFFVRQATLEDVDALMKMVDFWAKAGQNLPRKRNDIVRSIQTFAVCVRDQEVVGCACLYVYDSGLAEIRSLGVSPVIQRQGQGKAIVEFLLKRAARMFIKKVFVLTRSPEFFSRVGFVKTVKEALPEKILKDCENCPKRECCDEIAFIREIPSLNI